MLRCKLYSKKIASTIFDKILTKSITIYSWSILSIGIFSVFVPLYLVIYDLFVFCKRQNKVESKEQNYDVDYDDMRTKFMNEYDRANPITKDLAFKDYFSFIKSTRG